MLRNFVLLLLVVSAFADESDESINNYIRATLENLKSQMPHGIRELGIPVLDPLAVDNLNLNIKEGVANVGLKLDSTNVKGLSKFTVDHLSADLQQLKLSLKLNLHEIEAQSVYDLNGKVLIFPLYGKGRAFVKGHNVRVGGQAALTTTNEGYLQLADFKLEKISFDKADLLLENILGGGNLANVVNTVLNILGKTVFDKFSPDISKQLTNVLSKELNKQLRAVKLDEILKGRMPSFYVSSSDDVLSSGLPYEAETNSYIDQVLANARQEIARGGLDPLRLPDQSASFSKKIVFVTIHGEAKLYNGFLNGLSTLSRIGDVKSSVENEDTVVIEAQLGISNIKAGYSGSAKFQGIGPSISARATSSHAHIYIKVAQNFVNNNASPVLREFRITSLGGINANIDGLGPLGWTLGAISSVVVNVVKDVIVREIEGPIRDVIRNVLRNVKIPIPQSII